MPTSSVSGSIINGVFQGQITTEDGAVYYVDRKGYHSSLKDLEGDYHSIVYQRDHVNIDKFNKWV